jgi:hypothetical protein
LEKFKTEDCNLEGKKRREVYEKLYLAEVMVIERGDLRSVLQSYI